MTKAVALSAKEASKSVDRIELEGVRKACQVNKAVLIDRYSNAALRVFGSDIGRKVRILAVRMQLDQKGVIGGLVTDRRFLRKKAAAGSSKENRGNWCSP